MVKTIAAHPHKHLIRDLWPDKHLYATTLLFLGAGMGIVYAFAAWVIPVTYAPDMPLTLRGWGVMPALLLPGVAGVLAYVCYRFRAPAWGFAAATLEIVSFGALGVSTLLGLVAAGFLLRAKQEGEHENPATRGLHAHAWPDKSLAAALLLTVSGLASLVWALALFSGAVDVRSADAIVWGWLSIVGALIALAGAWLAYRQRGYGLCVTSSILVALTGSFAVLGLALSIGTLVLLSKARKEREFA